MASFAKNSQTASHKNNIPAGHLTIVGVGNFLVISMKELSCIISVSDDNKKEAPNWVLHADDGDG